MPLDLTTRRLFNKIDRRLKRGMSLRSAVQDIDPSGISLGYNAVYDLIERMGYEIERTGRLRRKGEKVEEKAA